MCISSSNPIIIELYGTRRWLFFFHLTSHFKNTNNLQPGLIYYLFQQHGIIALFNYWTAIFSVQNVIFKHHKPIKSI